MTTTTQRASGGPDCLHDTYKTGTRQFNEVAFDIDRELGIVRSRCRPSVICEAHNRHRIQGDVRTTQFERNVEVFAEDLQIYVQTSSDIGLIQLYKGGYLGLGTERCCDPFESRFLDRQGKRAPNCMTLSCGGEQV